MDGTRTPAEFVDLTIHAVAGVDAGANETQMGGARGWLVLKGAAAATTTTEAQMTTVETVTISKADHDALMARIDGLEKAARDAEDKGKDAEKDDEGDEVEKALAAGQVPEAVAKAIADMRAEVAKSRLEAETAVKAAEVEKNARVDREYVEKAAGYRGLPTSNEKFGPVLRSITELLPVEHSTEVLRLLKAAGEAGVFAEISREFGTDASGSTSAVVSIEKAAADLRAADPTLTVTKALELAMDRNAAAMAAHVKGA